MKMLLGVCKSPSLVTASIRAGVFVSLPIVIFKIHIYTHVYTHQASQISYPSGLLVCRSYSGTYRPKEIYIPITLIRPSLTNKSAITNYNNIIAIQQIISREEASITLDNTQITHS